MAKYSFGFKNTQTGKVSIAVTGMTKAEAYKMKEACKAVENDALKAVIKIEMNSHEKQIDKLIARGVSEIIGGWENTLEDYPEDHEEHKKAEAILNHDTLFDYIYDYVMIESASNYASHIRFAGKEFIEDRIESRLKKEGYGK